MNDFDIDLDRNTPWVDMSACVKFGLDRPSRLDGHTEHRYRQTDKHNAFYYIDITSSQYYCNSQWKTAAYLFLSHIKSTCLPKCILQMEIHHLLRFLNTAGKLNIAITRLC